MRILLPIWLFVWWFIKVAFYLILTVITALFEAITFVFRTLKDKCQPK